MIIEDATGQAEIQNCSRIPDAWSTNEGRDLISAANYTRLFAETEKVGHRIRKSESVRTLLPEICNIFRVISLSPDI